MGWRQCDVCQKQEVFKSPHEFCHHLREVHCSKEGGSFVCHYGLNCVCPSLPIEGVSDQDYEDHVIRHHVYARSDSSPMITTSVSTNNSSSIRYRASSEPLSPDVTSSDQPSLVQDQHKWTVFNSSVNLPALLNDPRRAKRETDFFTKTWGDRFELTEVYPSEYLPEITRVHFQRYLHRTSSRHKKHERYKNHCTRDCDDRMKTLSIKQIRQLEKNRVELEQVPKLFLLPNFSLENPDTFSAVFPWTQVEESRATSVKGLSSKLLQERLSHYLDVVEVQIAKQISQRSEAFFHAMTSHDELQEYLLKTYRAVKLLRSRVHDLDEVMVKGSLKILHLSQSRSNYVMLHNKLKLMATLHQTQPTIQLLLSTNEFVGALDLISTTQEVLSQELAGVQCFRHLGSQLIEMEKLIEKMLEAEFSKQTTSDLNRPVMDDDPTSEEERLVAILFGMLRLQKFDFVDAYREEVYATLKAVLKETVITAVCVVDDVDTEGSVGSLADQMRLLNYQQWMDLLKLVFTNITIILYRVKVFVDITLKVVTVAAGKSKSSATSASQNSGDASIETTDIKDEVFLRASVSDDVEMLITEDAHVIISASLQELLTVVCDHAHDRCVKLVIARAKDGFLERLSSGEFVNVSKAVELFVDDCQKICGKRSASLRASLQSQSNKFVTRFHEERKNKLGLILDNERWKQADVPVEFQHLVDHVSSTGTLSTTGKTHDTDSKPSESLSVDGQKYSVVGTVLILLSMMLEYCQSATDLPAAAPDLLTRLIDLLKTFNSRTCQLVLGAGALQLVGLKTITTRNLALASRCLQLVLYYLPKVRQHFDERLITKNNILKHFDHITKDYSDHIEEINNKLVTIMEETFDAQLIKWDVKAPMPSMCFRTICKQIAKLHETIIDLLPLSQVKILFQRVNKSFRLVLKKRIHQVGVLNDGGPQHAIVTANVTFFLGNYRTLKGLEQLAEENFDDIYPR